MLLNITQGDVKINVFAEEKICKAIYKTFFGFAKLSTEIKDGYNVFINENFDNVSPNAIPFKEQNSKLYSKIELNDLNASIWLNPEEDVLTNRQLIIFTITNIYSKLLYNNGYYFLHCSCVSKNGKAIAICGEKNVGKTVNLLNFLSHGYNFVTNDMLAIKKIEGGIICHGMPYYVGVRMTKPWITEPTNKKYIAFANEHNYKIPDNASLDENKLFISPQNVAKLNGVAISPFSKLEVILNPHYDESASKLNLKKMGGENLKALVYSQKLSPIHSSKAFLNNLNSNAFLSTKSRLETVDELSLLPAFYFKENSNLFDSVALFGDYILNTKPKNDRYISK